MASIGDDDSSVNHFEFHNALDTAYLDSIYSGDHAYALDMFSTYHGMIENELKELSQWMDKESLENIRKQAHKIKPVFSMVGLTHLTQLCEEIERVAEKGTSKAIKHKFDNLNSKVVSTLPIILSEMDRLKKLIKK